MIRILNPWLRKGALAVAGLALVFGASLRAQALPLVGVYEKSGFEYLVNLGDSSTFSSLAVNANIPEFGGSTAGALFTIVGVVDRTKQDSFGFPVANIIFTKTGAAPSALSDNGINSAQNLVAGNGTSDSWFDLIPSIINGGAGAHATLSATADTAFEAKVDNTFFGAFPFSTAGTIDANGNLHIGLYSAVAASLFDNTPTTIALLHNLNVTSSQVAVPEPTTVVMLGVALAGCALLRRRA